MIAWFYINAIFTVLLYRIGSWTRVEGTPNDPNPNKPFAKMENLPLFNDVGKLNPSITIVGKEIVICLANQPSAATLPS